MYSEGDIQKLEADIASLQDKNSRLREVLSKIGIETTNVTTGSYTYTNEERKSTVMNQEGKRETTTVKQPNLGTFKVNKNTIPYEETTTSYVNVIPGTTQGQTTRTETKTTTYGNTRQSGGQTTSYTQQPRSYGLTTTYGTTRQSGGQTTYTQQPRSYGQTTTYGTTTNYTTSQPRTYGETKMTTTETTTNYPGSKVYTSNVRDAKTYMPTTLTSKMMTTNVPRVYERVDGRRIETSTKMSDGLRTTGNQGQTTTTRTETKTSNGGGYSKTTETKTTQNYSKRY
ncbi:MAG: hypothetical protein GY928_23315 [Colwellia sp.]|nr:hypothetical protein [Colwellia sp.]